MERNWARSSDGRGVSVISGQCEEEEGATFLSTRRDASDWQELPTTMAPVALSQGTSCDRRQLRVVLQRKRSSA